MFLCTLATVFNLFLTGLFEVNNLTNFLISILISHFSRTHSVSRSPSKLAWNLFERFFLDVHLAFTWVPASVHLTKKNAYAVVETEERNRLAIAHPIRHSPLFFSRRLFLLLFGERGLLCRGVLFWGSGRIRFGFLRQTVLFFFLLFFSSSSLSPFITTISNPISPLFWTTFL